MKIGSWDYNKAFCTDNAFISQQVITASIAKPGEKKAYEIIP
jgi:hypothetical protein